MITKKLRLSYAILKVICAKNIQVGWKCSKRKIHFRGPSTYRSHTSNVYDEVLWQKIVENNFIIPQVHLNILRESGGVTSLKDQK